MADRKRSIKGTGQRKAAEGRPRLVKPDGKFSQLAELKSSTGIVVPLVKRVLLDKNAKNRERTARRSNNIFPSEMARSEWCPRATYFRMSGLPEPDSKYSFGLDNVFSEGNAIHAKWQGWLAETGQLWGDWYCKHCDMRINNSLKPTELDYVFGEPSCLHRWDYKEVTLRSTEHRISGHADGALYDENCLIEIKSMGIGTFRFEAPTLLKDNSYEVGGKKIVDVEGLWKNLHRPLLSHVKQGNIYLYMAKEMGMPFDQIVFLYEFKANQQVKEFRVSMSEDILKPMLDTCTVIENALAAGIPPPCPKGGCGSCKAYEGGKNEEKKSNYE